MVDNLQEGIMLFGVFLKPLRFTTPKVFYLDFWVGLSDILFQIDDVYLYHLNILVLRSRVSSSNSFKIILFVGSRSL